VKRFDGYVTPVNKLGIMMFPTQKAVENAVRKARKQGKLIVGIKPLAGGRIKPQEALSYVYKEIKADACMIGVSSVDEAKEDFETPQSSCSSSSSASLTYPRKSRCFWGNLPHPPIFYVFR